MEHTGPAYPNPSSTNKWRHNTERSELVERIIELDRQNRILQRTIREYAEVKDEDPSIGSYVTALQARILGLEENLDRLTRKLRAVEKRAAA